MESVEQTNREKFSEHSNTISLFQNYQQHLEDRHNKHERLVKLSRDVTIESKRIIFLLHRITNKDSEQSVLIEVNKRLRDLEKTKLKAIAEEIKDEIFLFLKAISPGLQEYIEAVAFYQYHQDKSLISLERLQERLIFKSEMQEPSTETNEVMKLPIPQCEFMLGLADMTGELMRKCISSVGIYGNISIPFEISTFLREIYNGMTAIEKSEGPLRQLERKLFTLKQSLGKVEKACYTIKVRGSEIPEHMLVDIFSQPLQGPEQSEYQDI